MVRLGYVFFVVVLLDHLDYLLCYGFVRPPAILHGTDSRLDWFRNSIRISKESKNFVLALRNASRPKFRAAVLRVYCTCGWYHFVGWQPGNFEHGIFFHRMVCLLKVYCIYFANLCPTFLKKVSTLPFFKQFDTPKWWGGKGTAPFKKSQLLVWIRWIYHKNPEVSVDFMETLWGCCALHWLAGGGDIQLDEVVGLKQVLPRDVGDTQHVPSRQRKFTIFNRKYIFKWWIFHWMLMEWNIIFLPWKSFATIFYRLVSKPPLFYTLEISHRYQKWPYLKGVETLTPEINDRGQGAFLGYQFVKFLGVYTSEI